MQNSILKRFVCLFSAFVILLSSFTVLFSNKHKVLADETSELVSFSSSNFFIPIQDFGFMFNFSYEYLSSSENRKVVKFNVSCSYVYDVDDGDITQFNVVFDTISINKMVSGNVTRTILNDTNEFTITFDNNSATYEVGFIDNAGFVLTFGLIIDSSFITNFVPYVVSITSDTFNELNVITYFDSSREYSLRFEFFGDYLYFTPRTYYLNLGADYNDGYNDGLIAGKEIGFRDGYNNGDSVGYERGYLDGKNYGIQIGQEQGGNYTFLSLMGAVVDAPLEAVKGLLDFEVFNFDVVNLFYGLVTISILLVILKYVI